MTRFFERLFGKREPKRAGQGARSQAKLDIDEFGHGPVSIAELDFIGHQAMSSNGLRWTIR